MTDPAALRARADRVEQLRAAAAERERAELRLRALVVEAVAAGDSIAEISRASGVSRPTIYAWSREGK